jgi:hypothetical protein
MAFGSDSCYVRACDEYVVQYCAFCGNPVCDMHSVGRYCSGECARNAAVPVLTTLKSKREAAEQRRLFAMLVPILAILPILIILVALIMLLVAPSLK